MKKASQTARNDSNATTVPIMTGSVKLVVQYTTCVTSGICIRTTGVGRTHTPSDYAQQVRSHFATKVGCNRVRIYLIRSGFVATKCGGALGDLIGLFWLSALMAFHKRGNNGCR